MLGNQTSPVRDESVTVTESTSKEHGVNKARKANTLSDLVILVESTCSPISRLRLESLNDPECNRLVRSSFVRLKAAAAALKAVTCIHDNESPSFNSL